MMTYSVELNEGCHLSTYYEQYAYTGGAHGTTELFGRALRLVQTGNLQTYAFLFAVGVAVVLLLVMF